jgi:hypothetical protein
VQASPDRHGSDRPCIPAAPPRACAPGCSIQTGLRALERSPVRGPAPPAECSPPAPDRPPGASARWRPPRTASPCPAGPFGDPQRFGQQHFRQQMVDVLPSSDPHHQPAQHGHAFVHPIVFRGLSLGRHRPRHASAQSISELYLLPGVGHGRQRSRILRILPIRLTSMVSRRRLAAVQTRGRPGCTDMDPPSPNRPLGPFPTADAKWARWQVARCALGCGGGPRRRRAAPTGCGSCARGPPGAARRASRRGSSSPPPSARGSRAGCRPRRARTRRRGRGRLRRRRRGSPTSARGGTAHVLAEKGDAVRLRVEGAEGLLVGEAGDGADGLGEHPPDSCGRGGAARVTRAPPG